MVKGLVVGVQYRGIDGSSITQIATDLTRGDLNRFFAGDPHAGVYMAWAYPSLWAACLALRWQCTLLHQKRVAPQ
ncbi:hypothetical protein ABFY58_26495 [Enterobacter soli]